MLKCRRNRVKPLEVRATFLNMFKRPSIFALLACALALGGSHVAHAKDTAAQSADRKAITAAYGALDRAFVKKDTNAIMAKMAPDFVAHSRENGVIGRDTFERVFRLMEASDTRVIYSTSKISKWQWRSPDAIVWVDSKNRMQTPRGTIMTWDTTRHYWGKIGGRWQIRQEVTLAYKSLLNGKPLR